MDTDAEETLFSGTVKMFRVLGKGQWGDREELVCNFRAGGWSAVIMQGTEWAEEGWQRLLAQPGVWTRLPLPLGQPAGRKQKSML